jgi:hypothetical protein
MTCSENPSGAVNQQERPIFEIGILRDYTPNTGSPAGEDIVRAAWRHAEVRHNHLDSKDENPLKSITWISEIPCRVSNIARGGGDTVPDNRLKSVKP